MLLVFISAAMLATSFGATVSLTGSCSTSSVSSNSVNVTFSLLNSGDFPATDVSLIPSGFGPLSYLNISSQNIGSVYPNVTKNATFKLENLPMPGTYILKVIVSYFQGSSNFFASFPCQFNYNSANLTDYVAPLSANYHSGVLKLELFNIAPKPLNVTTYIIAPPQVHYSPSSRAYIIEPQESLNSSFNVSMASLPGLANASISVSVVAGYQYGGFYHSTLENILLSSSSSHPGVLSGSMLVVIVFVVIIVVLIGLIIFSVTRKKRKAPVQ